MNMRIKTFRDLLQSLQTLNDEQLACTLTLFDCVIEEYYPLVAKLEITDEDCDVLDENHPVLAFNSDNTSGRWSLEYETN